MILIEALEFLESHGVSARQLGHAYLEGGVLVGFAAGIPVLHKSFSLALSKGEWVCTFAGGTQDTARAFALLEDAVTFVVKEIGER